MFAWWFIPKGDLCSIYSGLLIPNEIEDARHWDLNNNTIQLDAEYCIDVPSPYHLVNNYCASLGHKANHGFGSAVNSEYIELFHPRFGTVMSVVATWDI